MNNLTDIIKTMQQTIDTEQLPVNREKPLTAGLKKAINIIQEYQAQNNFAYEYNITGAVWLDVKDKEQLKKLEDLGYIVRRKNG